MSPAPSKVSQRRVERLGAYMPDVLDTLSRLDDADAIKRMWQRDGDLWPGGGEGRKAAASSLAWMNVALPMRKRVEELSAFVDEAKAGGVTDVLYIGVGADACAADLFASVFGPRPGCPALHVLDSVLPAVCEAMLARLTPARTLVVISSKSGEEPEIRCLEPLVRATWAQAGVTPSEAFVAVTDGSSRLESIAREQGYRRIFVNPADIGARFGALAYSGILPASLLGVDVPVLLDRALHSVNFCSFNTPIMGMPGARRGAALGALAAAGRNKMTLVVQPELEYIAPWIAQLVAGATAKSGRGILPIVGEPLGDPAAYGDDRVFVLVHDREYDDPAVEARLDALTAAGHPSLRIILNEHISIGEELFLWGFAVSLASIVLEVNPFEEPAHMISTAAASALPGGGGAREASQSAPSATVDAGLRRGRIPEVVLSGDSPSGELDKVLADLVASIAPGDCFALQAWLPRTAAVEEALAALRLAVRDARKVATISGFAPRSLRTLGRALAEGPSAVAMLQLLPRDEVRSSTPEPPISCAPLAATLADDEYEALRSGGRRVLRLRIEGPVAPALATLAAAVKRSL